MGAWKCGLGFSFKRYEKFFSKKSLFTMQRQCEEAFVAYYKKTAVYFTI
jgi:hypothetical protein